MATRGYNIFIIYDFKVPALALLYKGNSIIATFNNFVIKFQVIRKC